MTTDTQLISVRLAFLAMERFLTAYEERVGGDALVSDVLNDVVEFWADGMPGDPASWEDWLNAVAEARAKFTPPSDRT